MQPIDCFRLAGMNFNGSQFCFPAGRSRSNFQQLLSAQEAKSESAFQSGRVGKLKNRDRQFPAAHDLAYNMPDGPVIGVTRYSVWSERQNDVRPPALERIQQRPCQTGQGNAIQMAVTKF